jgi:hypothetical protein
MSPLSDDDGQRKSDSTLLFPAPNGGPALSAEASCGSGETRTPAPVAVESAPLLRLKSSCNQSTTLVVPTIHDCPPFRAQRSPARAALTVVCYVTVVTRNT